MAFTEKEIMDALVRTENWTMSVDNYNVGTRDSNLKTIISYLTDNTSTLSNTQQDYSSTSFNGLFYLIKNHVHPDKDDQRVIDVANHPDFKHYLSLYLSQYFFQLFYQTPNKENLDALIRQLTITMGSAEDAFVYLMVEQNHEIEESYANPAADKLLDEYFLETINKLTDKDLQNLQTLQNQNQFYYSRYWMIKLFNLFDIYRPDFASEYLLWGLRTEKELLANNILPILQQPKYVTIVENWLTEQNKPDSLITENKLNTVLALYDADIEKFAALAVQLSNNYLQQLADQPDDLDWENAYTSIEILSVASYTRLSSISFLLLFIENKQLANERLEDFLATKKYINPITLRIIAQHNKEKASEVFDAILASKTSGIDYLRNILTFYQEYFEPGEYLSKIWKLASHKSKPLRVTIANIISEKDIDAENKAIELLNDKNSDVRQTAALILGYFSSEKSATAIIQVLNKETNDNARDLLLQSVADMLPVSGNMEYVAQMVASANGRGKLNKPQETWLQEDELPALQFIDGSVVPALTVRFLIYRMSRVKAMQSDIEARYVLALLDKEAAAPFAQQLIQLYKNKGAKPEHKYLMSLAALMGNDSVVDKIRTTINNWIDENRYKMAEYGVGALALQGSDKALRWVEWYSRKYRSKKANVGAAALAALETAAEELNITTHELGDRIVPDFGFDGLFKEISINGEQYRAFIDSNFKIAYFDENNKKLKALPAAASKELKEEMKDIGKEVRDVVKSQSSRMEYYLITQRKWTVEQWQQFFLNNPVMFIYANKILWGVYDVNGTLQNTFMVNDDTSLLTVEEDETALQEDAIIGMVHPTQLSAELLQQWKQVFFDRSIDPVFIQLERKAGSLAEIDLNKAIIYKFDNQQMATGSIRSTLEKYGWHKGPTGDGGMLESFNLLYHEKQLEAVLEVNGVGAGYGWGMDEHLGRLYFVNKEKAPGKWVGYIKDDADEKLVALKDVPAIFLSETLAAVENIKPFEKQA